MARIPLITDYLALRSAQSLAEQHRFDEALQQLADFSAERALLLRERVREAAVLHWCAAAVRSEKRGQHTQARRRLDKARRYATSELIAHVHEVDRRFRVATLRATKPEHWLPLFEPCSNTSGFEGLTDAKLCRAAQAAWGLPLTVDLVEDASTDQLRSVRAAVASRFPAALHPSGGLDTAFVRGALFCALGRPDIAVLPLMSTDDREPLVLFLLARIAQSLGHPRIAQAALRDFEARAGGHYRIQRLHTGVFQAQMALACDEPLLAIQLFEGLPITLIGGRPALIFARLLIDHGRRDDAVALLHALQQLHPALEGLEPLSAEANNGSAPVTQPG